METETNEANYTAPIDESLKEQLKESKVEAENKPKKSLKIPALIIGIVMIIAGGIGIALYFLH